MSGKNPCLNHESHINTYACIIHRERAKRLKSLSKFAVTIKDDPVDFKNSDDSGLITALSQTRSRNIFWISRTGGKQVDDIFPSPWRRWTFEAINAESSEDPPQQIHAGSSHDKSHISGIWLLSCIILTRNQRARKTSVGREKTNKNHVSNIQRILKYVNEEQS